MPAAFSMAVAWGELNDLDTPLDEPAVDDGEKETAQRGGNWGRPWDVPNGLDGTVH
jgi:hypothetical protein